MYTGLSTAEAEERKKQGLINTQEEKGGRSYSEILKNNIFTFFNLLNLIFFVLVLIVGSYKNGLFMLVIVLNSAIGIIQEIRTKKKLDELRLLSAATHEVLRDGVRVRLRAEELVPDDLVYLHTGDQVSADMQVLDGSIEVNESMLTGESDPVGKKAGDPLYSGSFATGGSASARVTKVGRDCYAASISHEAKQYKEHDSVLRNTLNRILKLISIIILPLSLLLFVKAYFISGAGFQSSIIQLVTAGVGMIPEGLVLLTSIALTLGTLRLAGEGTIVQELFCIETLARIDVLCLDKTGTLTEGTVEVVQTECDIDEARFKACMQRFAAAFPEGNATQEALRACYLTEDKEQPAALSVLPFSSDRKFSGISLEDGGAFYLGAVQMLFPDEAQLHERVNRYAGEGLRVLAAACSGDTLTEQPEKLTFAGLVVMKDVLKKDCIETLHYLKEQGIRLKCISGDDPLTVSRIAERAGIPDAGTYIDLSTLHDEAAVREAALRYTVFGRVRPEQKRTLISSLKEAGHKVAMTGDGVNDVLALKEADCSIAMGNGADAAKHTADIILLRSDFSSVPMIVKEGRRVINNILASSSMYLIKTFFSVFLTLGTIFFASRYPVQAIQLTLISATAVAIPTFFLQLEPNYSVIQEAFMKRVIRFALPSGFTIALFQLLTIVFAGPPLFPEKDAVTTVLVLFTALIYFYMLARVFAPPSKYRLLIIAGAAALFFAAVLIAGGFLFDLVALKPAYLILLAAETLAAPLCIFLLERLYDLLADRFFRR